LIALAIAGCSGGGVSVMPVPPVVEAQQFLRAFPGAEGFGADTRGGRGGRVLKVTHLGDAGEGSLRAAVEATGPRIVIFERGGSIDLERPLVVREPFLTIAGQSAPGGGICLKRYPLEIRADEVIVRHLRVRPGDLSREPVDGVGVVGARNVILDHLSVSWSVDEALSVTHGSDLVTVQWCFITESLHESFHPDGNHGFGSLISGGRISWHHCLYAHHRSRNPSPGEVTLDFVNNVIFDWGSRCGVSDDVPLAMNYVGNSLRPGPSTSGASRGLAFWVGGLDHRIFLEGNRLPGGPESQVDLIALPPSVDPDAALDLILLERPIDLPAVTTEEADMARDAVLESAGATLPRRDAVDERVAHQARIGTGRHIDSQEEVGGWPALAAGIAPADGDGDGMPDIWEREHDFDPADDTDGPGDRDGDGYTNVEEYLNGTRP
jgi:hypothetical protein